MADTLVSAGYLPSAAAAAADAGDPGPGTETGAGSGTGTGGVESEEGMGGGLGDVQPSTLINVPRNVHLRGSWRDCIGRNDELKPLEYAQLCFPPLLLRKK
jgi:hypothetical protein